MDAQTRATNRYRLPLKQGRNDTTYSLDEILAYASPDIRDGYRDSYRMALAIQQLQREVEKAVSDPERSKKLFPSSSDEFVRFCAGAGFDKELLFDPTSETGRVVNGELSWRTPLIRQAQNDPLRMARKHVVDLLGEMRPMMDKLFQMADNESKIYRQNAASDVQQLMVLMADNAVHHQVDYTPEVARA